MLRLFPYLFLLFIIKLIACDSHISKTHIRPVLSDTSILPSDNDLFQAIPDFARKANLPSIGKGVDSLEYRLWCHISADVINLIRIRFIHSSWIISETKIWSHIPDYKFKRNDTLNHLLDTIVDSTKTRQLKPNISISEFLDSMQYFNLQEAPSNLEIEWSISVPHDSWRHTFEIADKWNYRIIEYNCPGDILSQEEFHKKIREMLLFLKRHLGVQFRDCL